ncbi:LOW QUALITY PROTEIN: squalene monooxygenase SE1 [Capsicum annuum]|uniref:LOW QUALITY PROTEIN: squalene monooxygenase SE1 n=1 Tax=Capsicum annuum TaxID=4072 RepID=UPI001FB064D7|nr:LOW QUALITY PROTEIN: squalene monooxygenase SE1 [Capsicum annuum]
MPDGYASNLGKRVDMAQGILHGMKSHDCHVFMEQLLSIVFIGLLENMWKPIAEISLFFKYLYATTLKEENLTGMKSNIVVITNKLEKIFPSTFFDVMKHLPIHLVHKARLGGPVQTRWMNPFERAIEKLKRGPTNKHRVEGSVVEDGRRLHVIERYLATPDQIVGEYLLPGGYLKLLELGLEECVENIDAQRVFGYVLFKDGKSTRIPYPLEKFRADVSGRGFHNGPFIQRMREKVVYLPNVKLEQGTVTTLLEEKGTIKGVQYKTKSGEELKACAPLTIVCDGCFSNLRRTLCNPNVDVPSYFVGLILENFQLSHANYGHVFLADPLPLVFYPISSTEVRCLVDAPGQRVPFISNGEMSKYLKTVVGPQVPPEIHDPFIAAVDKGNIRTMSNRSMPAAPHPTLGALLMSDAFNVRNALTDGGMTLALSDVVVLCNFLKPLHNFNDASTLYKYLESLYTLRKPVASTLNIVPDAFYKVFSASPDQVRIEMRQACFDYLSLGGVYSTGPISLLAGLLNPRPFSLVCHFFTVSIYGVGRLLLPFPSLKRMWISARLISSASGIIFPLIKAEGVRQIFFPMTLPAYYRASPKVRL